MGAPRVPPLNPSETIVLSIQHSHGLIDGHQFISVVQVVEHIVHELLPSAARHHRAFVRGVYRDVAEERKSYY